MIKWLGCALIVLSGIGFGGYFAERLAGRLRLLEELQRDLQYLYGEIEYSACNMPELFEKLSKRGGALKEFWGALSVRLFDRRGCTFSEIWKIQTMEMAGTLSFSEEGRRLFLELGDNLGNLDRMTQLNTLKLFQERLVLILKTASEEFKEREKVCYVLGVTAGLFLCILLL